MQLIITQPCCSHTRLDFRLVVVYSFPENVTSTADVVGSHVALVCNFSTGSTYNRRIRKIFLTCQKSLSGFVRLASQTSRLLFLEPPGAQTKAAFVFEFVNHLRITVDITGMAHNISAPLSVISTVSMLILFACTCVFVRLALSV